MKTAAERLRVVDKLRHQHPEKSPEEITDMADLVARTHPQFRAGRRRSMFIQAIPWILAAIAGLVATKEAKCQTTTIYLENGGTQQAGGPGTYRFDCDGSTVICSWAAATRTWTITGSGGGGGTPASPSGSFQFNDAGAFGGASDFTYVVTDGVGLLSFTPTVTIPAGNATNYNGINVVFDTTAGSNPGNLWVGATGINVALNLFQPYNANDATAISQALNFAVVQNSNDTVAQLYGLNGIADITGSGTAGNVIGAQFIANALGTAHVTGYNEALYAVAANGTGVPLGAVEFAAEFQIAPDGGAAEESVVYIDDVGGPTQPGGALYTIHIACASTTCNMLNEGNETVDGILTGTTINATTALQFGGVAGASCAAGTLNLLTAVVSGGLITTC